MTTREGMDAYTYMYPVQLGGIERPVIPNVYFTGKTDHKIEEIWDYCHNLTNNVSLVNNPEEVKKIALGVKNARPDYNSLLNTDMNRKLIEQKKISEEHMKFLFGEFDKAIWERCVIMTRLMGTSRLGAVCLEFRAPAHAWNKEVSRSYYSELEEKHLAGVLFYSSLSFNEILKNLKPKIEPLA